LPRRRQPCSRRPACPRWKRWLRSPAQYKFCRRPDHHWIWISDIFVRRLWVLGPTRYANVVVTPQAPVGTRWPARFPASGFLPGRRLRTTAAILCTRCPPQLTNFFWARAVCIRERSSLSRARIWAAPAAITLNGSLAHPDPRPDRDNGSDS
jgi:hypothetical protein